MPPESITGGELSQPRAASDFRPFAHPPGLLHEQLDAWLRAVRISPISAIEWAWRPGCRVGPRVLNDSMWFWFRHVNATVKIAGVAEPIRLHDGDLLLIPAGVKHSIHHAGPRNASTVAVHFHARVFGSISVLDLLRFPVAVPSRVAAAFLAEISARLAREFAVKPPGWAPMMEGLILQALTGILREGADLFEPAHYAGSAREVARLMPAFQFIEGRLADPDLSIGEIAGTIFLGEVRFRRIFRLATGFSPVVFLRRLRISRVCSELVTTEESIENIAQRCGFKDSRLMRKVFLEYVGTTPREYRRSVRLIGPDALFG